MGGGVVGLWFLYRECRPIADLWPYALIFCTCFADTHCPLAPNQASEDIVMNMSMIQDKN